MAESGAGVPLGSAVPPTAASASGTEESPDAAADGVTDGGTAVADAPPCDEADVTAIFRRQRVVLAECA